jgi:hypothetical protein
VSPREGCSRLGRTVRLTQECGSYYGAEPYYAVTYLKATGPNYQAALYTPFLSRAEWYYGRFLEDQTDAEALGACPVADRTSEPAGREGGARR